MSLYEDWIVKAYNEKGEALTGFWDTYMPKEQKVYEEIISNKISNLKGSVQEVAEKFDFDPVLFVGFLDGINDATNNTINMEEIELNTIIDVNINFENLYKKMVEYKAEHLYSLKEWDNIFSSEERNKFFKEQKVARTVVKDKKIGRNEPCPCGSNKKYKQCCGK